MVYIKIFLLILIITFNIMASKNDVIYSPRFFHPLQTKQAIENIRFLSPDGLYTYFQKNSGSLLLSKSYSTKVVFNDSAHTQYEMSSTQYRKKIIVTKDKLFYKNLNLHKLFEIFVLSYGQTDAIFIGNGRNPKLHLQDQWISFYDPTLNNLHIIEINGDQKKYKIPLTAPRNSFFQPNIELIKHDSFIFTDQISTGQSGIFLYYPQIKKKVRLYRSASPGLSHSLCMIKNKLIITEFSKGDIQKGSSIMLIDTTKSLSPPKIETLYNSSSNDLGQAICLKDNIFFLKERQTQPPALISMQDLYSLNISTKIMTQHTNSKNIDQIFLLDQKILLINAGQFYELSTIPYKKKRVIKNE